MIETESLDRPEDIVYTLATWERCGLVITMYRGKTALRSETKTCAVPEHRPARGHRCRAFETCQHFFHPVFQGKTCG